MAQFVTVPSVGYRVAVYAPGRIRTCDFCLRRAALYPLSYGRRVRLSVDRAMLDRRHLRHPPAARRRGGCPTPASSASRRADLLAPRRRLHDRRGAARARARSVRRWPACTATSTPPSCAGCCPAERVVEVERARASRCSTTPGRRRGRLERMRRRFGDRADAVVFGHSHLPLHERAADGFQIFNPGSPTERRRAPAHTMGLARVGGLRRSSFELMRASSASQIGAWTSTSSSSAPPARRPAPRRGLPATLVRRGGDRLLFDCGEGTQRQLRALDRAWSSSRRSSSPTSTPTTCSACPGMLKTFALRQRERPLTVYGPRRPARAVRGAAAARSAGCGFPLELRRARARTTSSSATATGSPPTRPTTASPALGYALVEDPRPGVFDPERAARSA